MHNNLRFFKHISQVILIIFALLIGSNINASNDEKITKKKIAEAKEIISEYPDSAIFLLSQAEEIAIKNNDKINLTEVYRRKGVAYYYLGDYTTAQDYNFKALKLRESNTGAENDSLNKAEIANIIYNIAFNYQYLEEYAKAIEYASKLEAIFLELNDKYNLAFRCYNFMSNIYYILGDYPKSQEFAYKELKINEDLKDQINISYSKDFLAMLKQDQGLNDEALKLQMESLEIRKNLNDALLLSHSFNNIGSTYLRMKDYKNALNYFLRALEIKEKYDDAKNIPSTLNNLGIVYQEMKDYDKSTFYGIKSYEYSKSNDNWYGMATAAINLGISYDLKKDYSNAEKYLLEAYEISIRNGYKNLIVDVTDFLSKFYDKQNRYKDAFVMLELNASYLDSLRNDDVIKQLTRMEVEYEFNKRQSEDSILRQHEKLVNQQIHNEQLRKKEQLVWIIVAIFLLIILTIFILFKSYQFKRKSAEQDLKRKALEIEKNLLRSQMNPHFIFNAMNSIQSFIAVNDTYSAERYLSKFARLIRLILENSTQSTVPLSEEILALKLYLDLEKARFNNKFDYDISISYDIEDELISVPPMLLQPFVENAIIHGMMYKESQGKITIDISDDEENQTLICEIVDDGIGREAAQKFKEKSRAEGKKHKSIGMQLTRERLDSLNKETQTETNCSIIDLYDNKNNPIGTKVIVRIPYFENQTK